MHADHAIAIADYWVLIPENEVKINQEQVLVGEYTPDGGFRYPLTVNGQREECTDTLNGPRLKPYDPKENSIVLEDTFPTATLRSAAMPPPIWPEELRYPGITAVLTDNIFAIATDPDRDEASKKRHIAIILDELVQLSPPPKNDPDTYLIGKLAEDIWSAPPNPQSQII